MPKFSLLGKKSGVKKKPCRSFFYFFSTATVLCSLASSCVSDLKLAPKVGQTMMHGRTGYAFAFQLFFLVDDSTFAPLACR